MSSIVAYNHIRAQYFKRYFLARCLNQEEMNILVEKKDIE